MRTGTIKFVSLLVFNMFIKKINCDNPIVETKVGLIRGIRAPDGDFDQYMGIPYATVNEENPFGNSVPQPVFEEVFDAFDDSAICPQIEEFNNTIVGSLDCLHLNIYVPTSINSVNKLPVMVHIHGGGFSVGFGGRFLYGAKYLVRHDVILVSLNYRVGAYGFMCLDTPEVPGNQGLRDQVLALRWLRENIESFGGDIDNITLFGNSAGAISIALHMLSQEEKFFTRMILQSGSALYPGIVTESDTSIPFKLAELLGYKTSDLNKALVFLAATDPASVVEAESKANVWCRPCKEKSFPDIEILITDHPINLPIPKAKGVSILLGANNKELLPLANLPPQDFDTGNYFSENLANIFRFESDDLVKLEYLVRRFYIGDEAVSQDIVMEIIDFMSDTSFTYSNDRSIKWYLDSGAENIFYYIFSYSGGRNLLKRRNNITAEGAAHTDELGYLFEMDFIPEVPSLEDQLILDRMTEMWANFAKYGRNYDLVIRVHLWRVIRFYQQWITWSVCCAMVVMEGSAQLSRKMLEDPTPQTSSLLPVKWEPITKGSVYHYLNIDSELSTGKRPFHQRMAFWDLFYDTYSEYERDLSVNYAPFSVSFSPILNVSLLIIPLFTILEQLRL